VVQRYGRHEKLQLRELTEPGIKENEVLVQVHAAGVNNLDAAVRNGEYKIFLKYKPPFGNGHDVAGVVNRTGSLVSRFKVGDEVYARVADYRIGTFAESIAVNENDLSMKPKNLSMEEAASIPLVGLTAWQSFVVRAKVKKGDKVFIQAGSGGVGTFAIQLAKHLGAIVATTTSTSNIEMVRRLGVDVIVDYKKEDFGERLKDYDFVLHSSSDPKVLKKSLRVLKPGGILVSLTGPPTPEFATQIGMPWWFRLISSLMSASVKNKARKLKVDFSFLFMEANGKQLAEITKLIEADVIKPVIDKVFSFEQTNDALSYVETGRAKGKVVIKLR